jgi:hypothetical protein
MMYGNPSGVPKEKAVRNNAISLRRRYLMMAGLVGAAAPAVAFAGATASLQGLAVSSFADKLVVSGRILGADGRPLSGATVEILPAGSREPRGEASTDGDGRFFTELAPAGGDLRYRVRHDGRATSAKQLRFTRGQMQRDEAGAWRATFGATLA